MTLPPAPFHMINAFAGTPRAGNQASVVVFSKGDPRATDEGFMQAVARDFNLSETAYLVPLDDAAVPVYGLRWFTPTAEVPLCGHATLASATVLFNFVHPDATKLKFETRWRGALEAYRESEAGQGVRIGLSLPISEITIPDKTDVRQAVCAAAGLKDEDILRIAEFDFGGPSPIVELVPSIDLKNLPVDQEKLLPAASATCVYTQAVPGGTDGALRANSRVFAPGLGVPEDPVTGSAWAVLTGYYLNGPGTPSAGELLPAGTNVAAATIDAHQVSERGGALTCTLRDGRAYIVGRGWRTAYGELDATLPTA